MIFKNIGDLRVSSVILGTDTFGSLTDEKTVFELIDTYVDMGGTTIDTARNYGFYYNAGNGASESSIGKWLKVHGGRDKIVISTKCAYPEVENININRLSEADIKSDVDESLKALGTDYIDILWLHRDDKSADTEKIIDTLNRLKKSGKVRCFGVSNWRSERIKEANAYAKKHGKTAFCASQIKWSAARSAPSYKDDPTLVEMDRHEYDFYRERKMPVFAYASQAKGFFQKYHIGGEEALSKKARERYLCEQNIMRYKKLLNISEKYNISLDAAVISAITSNTDFDTSAIVGCRSTEQLKASMQGSNTAIDYDDVREIFEI